MHLRADGVSCYFWLASIARSQTVSSALFLSPQVAFLPVCPHCSLPVQTHRIHPAINETEAANGDRTARGEDADEPNLDAWVTTHLGCLPFLTELLAFVQEPEEPAPGGTKAGAAEETWKVEDVPDELNEFVA